MQHTDVISLYNFHPKDLDDLVEATLLYYGGKKLLDNTPIPLKLEKDNDPRLLTSHLKFPGKLAVDVLNNRLFISDSNHNCIVSFAHPLSPLPVLPSSLYIMSLNKIFMKNTLC